jgi:hypothetical protein
VNVVAHHSDPSTTADTEMRDAMSTHHHIEATVAADDVDEDVQLLGAAGQARTAWHDGDALAARRWSLCVAGILMDRAEAAGFSIWDRRMAVTPRRRAGHDAWSAAWHIARGEPEAPGRRVDDLLPLVALYLVDDASAAA